MREVVQKKAAPKKSAAKKRAAPKEDYLVAAAVELLRSGRPLTQRHREQIARLLEGNRRGRRRAAPLSATDNLRRAVDEARDIVAAGHSHDEAVEIVVAFAKWHGISLIRDQVARELRRSKKAVSSK